MQRPHLRQPRRRPALGRALCPTLFAGLVLAACSEAPLDPVDQATSSDPAFPVATALFPASPSDHFDGFDTSVWQKQEHWLGRGMLLAGNVSVEASQLRLALSPDGYQGGEIISVARYGAGSYAASLACGAPAGALCAFFFYQTGVGDAADEIDIEILPGTGQVWFTTWVRGRRTNHASYFLGSSAAASHTYGIVRSGTSVAFYVDGKQVVTFRKKVPTSRMPLLVNAWWPVWLDPSAGGSGSLDVDWIDWH